MRVLVIGAGLSGATVARLHAEKGDEVLVCEQADQVGGMCADEPYETWYEPLHGPHFVHTNDAEVWSFLSRFTAWIPYEHRVLAAVNRKLVPIPVNIDTVNALFELHLKSVEDIQLWFAKECRETMFYPPPRNSEEVALQRVGRRLYELLFEPYTLKQWGRNPRELPPEILARIPVRLSHDDRYFTDTHQAIPKDGYTKLVERMLEHDQVRVYFGAEALYWRRRTGIDEWDYDWAEREYYTGRIDGYWGETELEYRSLRFESVPEPAQPATVINYPGREYGVTRGTQMAIAYAATNVFRRTMYETPCAEGPPYYPVPIPDNLAKYSEYQRRALELEAQGIYMVGRLATYKYLNMDQAVRAAMDLVRRLP